MSTTPVKTAIIIVGPTASGKTAYSLELAGHFNSSIISADSRQCYREMNIGVAKPSPAELARCTHYFINTHSIHENVDAVVFEREALEATSTIFSHHNVAIVTGGTGLYVKVYCEGIDEMPEIPDGIRAKVVSAREAHGIAGLRNWLEQIDPAFLAYSRETSNPVRLMRALEVKLASGRSILEFRAGRKKTRDFRIRKIGINCPRDILYRRINERVDHMMEQGLLEEVKALYPYRDLKALQTVGYQEIFEHLDGKCTLQQAVGKIKQHTRNYAKRQMTWFSRDKDIKWVAYDKLPVASALANVE
jgi:tRNA dimethylallyltransferase